MSVVKLAETRHEQHDLTSGPHVEELARSEQQLAATWQHAGIGIAEVDAKGTLLHVNAQLCSMLGYGSGELEGCSIFEGTNPEDVEEDRVQFSRQVTGAIERYSIEKRIRHCDGRYIWTSVTSSSVLDAAGRFFYAVRVQHDVSDRKHAEELLVRRMDEQAALYEFIDRIQHVTSSRNFTTTPSMLSSGRCGANAPAFCCTVKLM